MRVTKLGVPRDALEYERLETISRHVSKTGSSRTIGHGQADRLSTNLDSRIMVMTVLVESMTECSRINCL